MACFDNLSTLFLLQLLFFWCGVLVVASQPTPLCKEGDTLCAEKCLTSSLLQCVEGECVINNSHPDYQRLVDEEGVEGVDLAIEAHCEEAPYWCHETNTQGTCTDITFLCGESYCSGLDEGCMYLHQESHMHDLPQPADGAGCEHLEDRCNTYEDSDVTAICEDKTWFRYFPKGCSTPDCANWAYPKFLCGNVNCFPATGTVVGGPVEEGGVDEEGVDILSTISASARTQKFFATLAAAVSTISASSAQGQTIVATLAAGGLLMILFL